MGASGWGWGWGCPFWQADRQTGSRQGMPGMAMMARAQAGPRPVVTVVDGMRHDVIAR